MSVAQLPDFTMRQLLEAGVHFGHQTHRWNPKMSPYIFGARNNIHIIDLRETVPLLHQALVSVREVIGGGGRLLFVGTKRQASTLVADAAQRCGQYYVNHRWLGGMLTNWKTISNSIRRLRELDEQMEDDSLGFTKKEQLKLTREREKLHRALGGIKDMGGLPDMLFVIDIIKEEIAVKEARKLGIPTIGVVDTNVDPDMVTYPVPGNDDAGRAIELYLDLVSRSVISGLQYEQVASGADIGASEELPEQVILEDAPALMAETPAEPEAVAPAEPEVAPAEPEVAPAAPETPAEPEAAAAEPEVAPAEPEAAPAEPEVAPAAPEPSPRRRRPSPRWHQPSPRRRQPSPRRRQPSPRWRQPSPNRRRPRPRRRRPSPRRHRPSPNRRPPGKRRRAWRKSPQAEPGRDGASASLNPIITRGRNMTQITAAQVKALRDQTGAGMMDCKKALAETEGDIEAATDWLRAKGLAAAQKKAGRVAAEGLIAVRVENGRGGMVEVNSETDFVARNEEFQAFVDNVGDMVNGCEGDAEALKGTDYPSTGHSVGDELTRLIGTIGENLQIRRATSVAVASGVVGSYVHSAIKPGLGRIGVLVGLESDGASGPLEALAKQVAMHVAASAPRSVDVESLPRDVVDRERAVLSEQARESGRPEEIIQKMVDGRMRKFYQDSVLLEQTWVHDAELTVAKAIAEAEKELGAEIRVAGFERFVLGDGVEATPDE